MNVQELLDKLLTCPRDAEVLVEGCPGMEIEHGICEGEEDQISVGNVIPIWKEGFVLLRRVK